MSSDLWQLLERVPDRCGEPREIGSVDAAYGEQVDVPEPGPGEVVFARIDGAEVKLTVPYSVAKAIFVENNPQAGMQAFMSGQIKVEGDMTKLMAMQSSGSGGDQAAIQAKLREITAED